MAGPNGAFNDAEVLRHSVTEADAQVYQGSPLVFFALPTLTGWGYYSGVLPPTPPVYWRLERDMVLRATVLHESLWSSAVNIAATKTASLGWEVEGDYPLKVRRAQEMMLSLDNEGWVKAQGKGVRDFITTDNGEWWEIVRATQGAGSRILGLMHLDSLRCYRTGDPARPVIYADLKGKYHELRDYQVINLVDMPNPGAEWLGVGLCAASRAYPHIFKLAAIEQYVSEKVSGSRPQEIHFVRGVLPKQLDQALRSADKSQAQKGAVMFKGAVVVPIPGDGTVEGYRVPLAELPDGFDRKQEFDLAITAYADAIGLDQQDLQPLSGQGLGTGAQSYVLWEKAKGKGLAARRQDWIHQINDKVNPDGVTFAFNERDLSDELKEAEVSSARAATRGSMISNGEITAIEARQLAVDSDDLPKEFTPPEGDVTPEDNLSDFEKPLMEGEVEPLPMDLPDPDPAPAPKTEKAYDIPVVELGPIFANPVSPAPVETPTYVGDALRLMREALTALKETPETPAEPPAPSTINITNVLPTPPEPAQQVIERPVGVASTAPLTFRDHLGLTIADRIDAAIEQTVSERLLSDIRQLETTLDERLIGVARSFKDKHDEVLSEVARMSQDTALLRKEQGTGMEAYKSLADSLRAQLDVALKEFQNLPVPQVDMVFVEALVTKAIGQALDARQEVGREVVETTPTGLNHIVRVKYADGSTARYEIERDASGHATGTRRLTG